MNAFLSPVPAPVSALAIAAHKNGHNAPDKRGGIALEEAGNAERVMIARSGSP